jgi:hypothetical protein
LSLPLQEAKLVGDVSINNGHLPRYVVAGHYRLCVGLSWDDVRERVTAEAGDFASRTAELVARATHKYSACPTCGQAWAPRPARNISPYHIPRP